MKPRKAVSLVAPYVAESSRKDKIRMDLNESIKGCSPKVVEALQRLDLVDITSYPEYDVLTEKIADLYKINPGNILVTNGADEAIRCILESYTEKSDKVLIPSPTFPMFEILATLREVDIVKIMYNTDLTFPLELFRNMLSLDPKIAIIVNPNSPTGTSVEKDVLKKILAEAKNTVFLVDEAYADFTGVTAVDLVNDFENLFVVKSFSKAFGLAGLRLGYAVSNEENIKTVRKVKLPYSANSLAVIAGLAALEDLEYAEAAIKEMKREKEDLYRNLKEMGLDVFMTDANFLLVNFRKECAKVCSALYERNILIKKLEGYPLEGYVRITVGTPTVNTTLLHALKEIL